MTLPSLKVPVLFLIFNRQDTTQLVFSEIRKARPAKLFVAADGPRKDHPTDRENCRKAREIVSQIDWDCAVFTLFREENLGCKKGVSSAIDWFFSQVEEGIIIEDDCVPDQSFFLFCQELLRRYRDDERIMMISGTNYLFDRVEMKESYYFSKYYAIWGWATWKRAWSLYDINMTRWPEYDSHKYLNQIYRDSRIVSYFRNMMQDTYDHKLDTWDIEWVYSCIFNSALSISPKYNLISNIGNTGIHTIEPGPFHNMARKEIDVYALIHPSNVVPYYDLDTLSFNEIVKGEPLRKKIFRLARAIKKKLLKR